MRPRRLVVVTGTGTDVGKTWVASQALRELRARGLRVAARKPIQSFATTDGSTDAGLLAAASAESPTDVCPPHRSYPTPMAPPMAAAALGRPVPTLTDLVQELGAGWPTPPVDIGLLEGAGGVASPLASDGDTADLADAVRADGIVLVADAGLGTINLVRLSLLRLGEHRVTVHLNRYDDGCDLHTRNRAWLVGSDASTVTTTVTDLVSRIMETE